ncbi:MAG: hypothetical protein AABZ60_14455 [Planctomycetota bacterium]
MRREFRELSTFSLSFLDVICCALGAIILLFVLNSQKLTQDVDKALDDVSESVRKYRTEAERANLAASAAERMELKMRQARNEAEDSAKSAQESRTLALKNRDSAEEAKIRAEKAEQSAKQEAEQMKKTLSELEQALAEEEKLRQETSLLQKSIDALQQKLGEETSHKGELSEALTKSTNQLKSILDKSGDEQTKLLQELRVLRETNGQKDAELQELKKQNQLLSDQLKELNQDKFHASEQLGELKSMETDREEQLKLAQKKIKLLEEQAKNLGAKSIFGIQPQYKRVLFLLDCSGSIEQSPKVKEMIMQTFTEVINHCAIDEFALVGFAASMHYFPEREGLMMDGREEHKKLASEWYRKQTFKGQTFLRVALEKAYEEYDDIDAIFILTDGAPREGGTESTPYLIEKIKQYVRAQVQKQKGGKIQTRIVALATGVPPQEHEKVYQFLHEITDLTGGQYLGR